MYCAMSLASRGTIVHPGCCLWGHIVISVTPMGRAIAHSENSSPFPNHVPGVLVGHGCRHIGGVRIRPTREYLVRWARPGQEDTWEPIQNLHAQIVNDYEHARQGHAPCEGVSVEQRGGGTEGRVKQGRVEQSMSGT